MTEVNNAIDICKSKDEECQRLTVFDSLDLSLRNFFIMRFGCLLNGCYYGKVIVVCMILLVRILVRVKLT